MGLPAWCRNSVRPWGCSAVDLVLATANPGKIREFRVLLVDLAVTIREPGEWRIPPVEETGQTFIENAILKARHAAFHSGLPALADDSGLEVDALAGAPGVRSARYAGEGASDAENCEKLLRSLDGVEEARRGARFQCVLALLRHPDDPTPLICQGTWEGRIVTAPRGTGGFGYDPLFLVPGRDCTAAELEPLEKNRLSHRGQALARLRKQLVALGG